MLSVVLIRYTIYYISNKIVFVDIYILHCSLEYKMFTEYVSWRQVSISMFVLTKVELCDLFCRFAFRTMTFCGDIYTH